MRKVVINLHLYLALIVGVFVVIVGVTGSIMAFEQEIDRFMNPRLFKVQPQAQALAVADLLSFASKAYPGQRIGNLRLPQSPSDSASFTVKGPATVFISPYNGEILGERSGMTTLNAIHQIHMRLLLGSVGANIVFTATCVLLFLVISGVYLWWPLRRFKVKWGANARRIHFDLHNVSGIYSAVFLLVLGVTGLLLHFNDDIERYLLRSSGAVKIGKSAPSVVQPGVAPVTPDQALQIALNELPGTKVLSISVPANAKASYLVALRYPEDLTPGGRSWLNVDQYSGKVVNVQNSRTAAGGTRFRILNRATHTGDLFGNFTKIVMSVSSLLLVVQAITGYYMWWKKTKMQQQRQSQLQTADTLT